MKEPEIKLAKFIVLASLAVVIIVCITVVIVNKILH